MLDSVKLWLIGGLVAAILAGGAALYFHGRTDADNARSAKDLKATTNAVKERAKVEDEVHTAPDGALIDSVR